MSRYTAHSTNKLLKLASASTAPGPALLPVRPHDVDGSLVGEWLQMLDRANGFYCFESALHEWAQKVVADVELITGYPVGRKWQSAHGALATGHRLVPKKPFVLGGDYQIKNLYSCEAVAGMRARGNLARQIADVPDGTPIKYQVIE
jgi:hypothetical protein